MCALAAQAAAPSSIVDSVSLPRRTLAAPPTTQRPSDQSALPFSFCGMLQESVKSVESRPAVRALEVLLEQKLRVRAPRKAPA